REPRPRVGGRDRKPPPTACRGQPSRGYEPGGSLAAGTAAVRWRRGNEGKLSGPQGPSAAGYAGAGPALRRPQVAAESGVHVGGGAVPGPGDRGQYCDLQSHGLTVTQNVSRETAGK